MMDYFYNYLVLNLDGTSYATAESDIGLPINASKDFSIDAWIRVLDSNNTRTIIAQENAFKFEVRGKSISFNINGLPTITSKSYSQPINGNQWHHVCVVYAAPQILLYIDGEKNCSASYTSVGKSNSNPFIIGEELVGDIREVRIFNKGLDSDTVLEYMLGEPKSEDLQAFYDFKRNPPIEIINTRNVELYGNATILQYSPGGNFFGKAFIEIPDHNINPAGFNNDPYTIQAWVKLDKFSDNNIYTIVSNGNSKETAGILLYLERVNDKAYVKFRHGVDENKENTIISTNDIPLAKWVNIAVTFQLETLSLYINGVLDIVNEGVFPITSRMTDNKLYIGSDTAFGNDNGGNWFNGQISRVDIWDKALINDEIVSYSYEYPETSDDNLVGSFDLTMSSPNNSVNSNPLRILNSLMVKEDFRNATNNEVESRVAYKSAEEPLSREVLKALRDKVDFTNVLGKLKEDRSNVDNDFAPAFNEIISRLGKDPKDFSYYVNSHKENGTVYFVAHDREDSYTIGEIAESELAENTLGMTPEEITWWIGLVLIILGGVLLLILGVRINRTERLVRYIQRKIITIPTLLTLFKGAVTLETIIAAYKSIYNEGLIKGLLKELLVGLGFWTIAWVITKLVIIIVGSPATWVIYAVNIATVIATITYHIYNRPSSITLTSIEIASINFNHNIGGYADAINIRRNSKDDISQNIPEWSLSEGRNEPAVYSMARLSNSGIKQVIGLRANFETTDKGSFKIWIRAKEISTPVFMGNTDEVEIEMKNGASGYVMFQLNNHELIKSGIQKKSVQWRWEYSTDNKSTWQKMRETTHSVYTILDYPTTPWGTNDNPHSLSKPWIAAIDFMLPKLQGVKTKPDLAQKVTEAINSDGKLKYDTTAGVSNYTEVFHVSAGNLSEFKLTDFMKYTSNKVNCTDCATIVSTFVNLFGGNLYAGIMSDGNNVGYRCNKIISIGFSNWEVPFPPGGGFSYHEVAFADDSTTPILNKDASYNGLRKLYDACLKINSNNIPWDNTSPKALLPINMSFSQNKSTPPKYNYSNADPVPDDSYREHLAKNTTDGISNCLYQTVWSNANNGRRPVR